MKVEEREQDGKGLQPPKTTEARRGTKQPRNDHEDAIDLPRSPLGPATPPRRAPVRSQRPPRAVAGAIPHPLRTKKTHKAPDAVACPRPRAEGSHSVQHPPCDAFAQGSASRMHARWMCISARGPVRARFGRPSLRAETLCVLFPPDATRISQKPTRSTAPEHWPPASSFQSLPC